MYLLELGSKYRCSYVPVEGRRPFMQGPGHICRSTVERENWYIYVS